MPIISRTTTSGYLDFTHKEGDVLPDKRAGVEKKPQGLDQESNTPKVKKFLDPLFAERNPQISSGVISSLYDRMLEQRDSWLLKYRETIRIGSTPVVILTYKLPDGSIRHCFDRPEKIIGCSSPGEALVINALGDVDHGVHHKI